MAGEDDNGGLASRMVKGAAQGAVKGGVGASPLGLEAAATGASLGAVAGALAEGVGWVSDTIRQTAESKQGVERADDLIAASELDDNAEKLEAKWRELEAKVGSKRCALAILPIVNDWRRARRTAYGKKQRVIMAAMMSAFDPESFEQGMAPKFFAILEQLDYPEVRYLCELYDGEDFASGGDKFTQMREGERVHFLAESLERLGLMISQGEIMAGLLLSPTWLGQELVAFLRRGGYSASEEGSDADGASE